MDATRVKYYHDIDPSNFNRVCRTTNIQVLKADTLEVAKTLNKPLVLILSDAHQPGGCVAAGAGMQEESLFRRSSLHKHLVPSLYPIEDDGAIYAPHVELLDGSYMDFVACPGIKMPVLVDNRLLPEDEEKLRKKVHLILQLGQKEGYHVLVLGALGCGVWGCPTRHVAQIFKEVIQQYDGVFSNIVFAVLGANFNFFEETFEENNSSMSMLSTQHAEGMT
jgi:uncharacterized protein (TIGR02452 family)